MQRRVLLIGAIALLSLFIWSCSKLDTTDIGSDLIPAVDNVHTFADTIPINTTQGIFNDTTRIGKADDHALGKITGDPIFGQTTANVYMQLKPPFYPYYYGKARDTIIDPADSRVGFDSVVLCINYRGFWGDSTQPISLQVRTVNQHNGIWDSLLTTRDINFAPTTGALIGSANVDVRTLGNYTIYRNKRDSSRNQIRIRLSSSFENALFGQDSTAAGPNNALRSDSLFKVFNNGIAVLATSGNGLMYCNLADTNTKLEVHYRKKKDGVLDTTYSSFPINTNSSNTVTGAGVIINTPSATANNVVRNRAGSAMLTPAPDELYIQTTPGSYVNLNIPGIALMDNRIIHRAEIIIQQIPNLANPTLDQTFTAPGLVYLDLKDTGTTDKWKPIYFDLNPSVFYNPDTRDFFEPYFPSSTGIDFFHFGGYRREMKDKFGNNINYYNINITRYIQQIVTKHTPSYDLRLYAPYYLYYPQIPGAGFISFDNPLAKGRVKVGSGTNANYKMILRVIYSKI